MRWISDDEAWERKFAYVPVRVGNTNIWWEHYYQKWNKEASTGGYVCYDIKSFDGEPLGKREIFVAGD